MKSNNLKPDQGFKPNDNELQKEEQWFSLGIGKAKIRLYGKGQHASILADPDYEELRELEKRIPGGKTVFDRGQALRTIKDRLLYKHYGDGLMDFDECVRAHWGMSEKYAYRLIKASSVYDDLMDMPDVVMPKNEAQVRHLAPFDMNQRRLLWTRIVELANDRRITEKLAKKVVEEFTKQYGIISPRPERRPIKLNTEAICRLQRYTGYTMRALEREDPKTAMELLTNIAAQLYGSEGPQIAPDYEI